MRNKVVTKNILYTHHCLALGKLSHHTKRRLLCENKASVMRRGEKVVNHGCIPVQVEHTPRNNIFVRNDAQSTHNNKKGNWFFDVGDVYHDIAVTQMRCGRHAFDGAEPDGFGRVFRH